MLSAAGDFTCQPHQLQLSAASSNCLASSSLSTLISPPFSQQSVCFPTPPKPCLLVCKPAHVLPIPPFTPFLHLSSTPLSLLSFMLLPLIFNVPLPLFPLHQEQEVSVALPAVPAVAVEHQISRVLSHHLRAHRSQNDRPKDPGAKLQIAE